VQYVQWLEVQRQRGPKRGAASPGCEREAQDQRILNVIAEEEHRLSRQRKKGEEECFRQKEQHI